jgi:flagellar biosynthesis protein FlhG
MELTRLITMDQAEGLRTLMDATGGKKPLPPSFDREGEETSLGKWPRVISVSSGKGGVGKTNVVANLAFALTQLGKKVLVWDADLGLANIDILLGLTPQYTIEHLLSRKKNMREILLEGPGGMTILPAGSGVLELADLNESQKLFLLNELEILAGTVDFLLIDTGAGISSNVLYFNMAAEESIVLVTPEPTAITDAYALMKVLSKKYQKKRFTILVNYARTSQEAKEVFRKISRVVDRFLGNISLDYVGFIPFDEKLPVAVKHQRPVLEIFPQAVSSRSFMEVTRGLMDRSLGSETHGNLQFFWRYLLQCQQPTAQQGGIE